MGSQAGWPLIFLPQTDKGSHVGRCARCQTVLGAHPCYLAMLVLQSSSACAWHQKHLLGLVSKESKSCLQPMQRDLNDVCRLQEQGGRLAWTLPSCHLSICIACIPMSAQMSSGCCSSQTQQAALLTRQTCLMQPRGSH